MLCFLQYTLPFKTCPHQKEKVVGFLPRSLKLVVSRTKPRTDSMNKVQFLYASSEWRERSNSSEAVTSIPSLLSRAKSIRSACVVGATGFVGQHLVNLLARAGVELTIVTRDVAKAKSSLGKYERRGQTLKYFELPSSKSESADNFKDCFAKKDAVVNLAGAPVAGRRWSETYKEELISSRVGVTQRIVDTIKAIDKEERPKVLVNASAVGYYGVSDIKEFDETSPPGDDFLAYLCRRWESAAQQLDQSFGTRVVILRLGVVIGPGGGVLASMTPIFQMFLGGPVGTGRQWISWIQMTDLISLIISSITREDMYGVYNACSPNPVTMNDFCTSLGNVIARPSWLPVPAFVVRAVFGEGSIIVVDGQKVYPSRTLASGFQFQYPSIYSALKASLNQS